MNVYSDVTLYSWLKQCQQQGVPVPGNRDTADDWSPESKLAVVIETASLCEAELSHYCREKGLYVEQVQRWKAACLQGASQQKDQDQATQKQQRQDKKTIKRLQAEVRRKDRVLADQGIYLAS